MTNVEITHDTEGSRYLAYRDGEQVGVLDYRVNGDAIVFTYTGVPKQYEGQGIAGQLVQQAMDDVRAGEARKVVPACSYVDAWIRRHPDYHDLVT